MFLAPLPSPSVTSRVARWHRLAGVGILAFSAVSPCFAQSSSGTTLNLLANNSLLAWKPTGTWSPSAGALTTSGSGPQSLLSVVPFADLTFQFEYNVSGSPNAALRLWSTRDGTGGYRIDLDNNGSSAGVGGIEGSGRSRIASITDGWHHVMIDGSGGQLTIQIDGQQVAHLNHTGTRAGYVAFETTSPGSLAIRNVSVIPRNLTGDFNGADLSGWTAIEFKPDPASGVGHTVQKTLTFGLGGSNKPHAAKWTVRNGAIHGEDGPGGLQSGSMYGDVILHILASVKGASSKKDHLAAIGLRDTPGRLNGGYDVGVGAYAGQIAGLSYRIASGANTPVDQTIIIANRTIAIWIGPNLMTVYKDSRPESPDATLGARIAKGPLTLLLPDEKEALDVQRIGATPLPAAYGVATDAPPPAPTPSVVAPATAAPAAAASAAEAPLLQQLQTSAQKDAQAQADRQRAASLMSQALTTSDPQQQMSLYSQVVQIDPANTAAVQGYKDAQTKVLAQQANNQKQQTDEIDQQRAAAGREQQTTTSLSRAETSFLGGHLSDASRELSIAERLAPDNPLVRDLRSRISSATAVRSRLYMLGGGAGLLGLATLIALWWRRRRQTRHPVLEITQGLDAGSQYPIDKDRISIGAVAQDGGRRNDIVVHDVEHAISRFHCEIRRRNGQLYLTDLHSSNGTSLDGQLLEADHPVLLRRGARIDLGGSVELKFTYEREAKKV